MLTIIKKFDDVMASFGFKKNKRRSDIAKAHGLGQDWYDVRGGAGIYHQKENPSLPNTLEKIDTPLYDDGDGIGIVSATTTGMDYFTIPVGQSNKTLRNTNMIMPRQVPSPDKFTINRVGLFVASAITADMYALLTNCVWTFRVNSKIYQQAPIYVYPSGFGIYGFSTANAVTAVNNGFPGELGVRSLIEPIPLEPLDPFSGNITVYAGSNNAIGGVTLTATTRIQCILQGPYQRAI